MKKFIQRAIKRPGALRSKARKAGESTREYARKHKHSPGRTGRQARFALTLMRLNKHRGKRRSRR